MNSEIEMIEKPLVRSQAFQTLQIENDKEIHELIQKLELEILRLEIKERKRVFSRKTFFIMFLVILILYAILALFCGFLFEPYFWFTFLYTILLAAVYLWIKQNHYTKLGVFIYLLAIFLVAAGSFAINDEFWEKVALTFAGNLLGYATFLVFGVRIKRKISTGER